MTKKVSISKEDLLEVIVALNIQIENYAEEITQEQLEKTKKLKERLTNTYMKA